MHLPSILKWLIWILSKYYYNLIWSVDILFKLAAHLQSALVWWVNKLPSNLDTRFWVYFVTAFLSLQVSQESIFNKMSSSNLACVFGVNLAWPRHGGVSLSAITPLNMFTELLIEHYEAIFSSHCPPQQVLPWLLHTLHRASHTAASAHSRKPNTWPCY